jgi:preprotein translocase subunit SecD
MKIAGLTKDDLGSYAVSFELDEEGTRLMADYSKSHIGKYLAIVQDKKVVSCPRINAQIPDGKGIIQGNFTQETAQQLAVHMRYKALPFKLSVESRSEY